MLRTIPARVTWALTINVLSRSSVAARTMRTVTKRRPFEVNPAAPLELEFYRDPLSGASTVAVAAPGGTNRAQRPDRDTA